MSQPDLFGAPECTNPLNLIRRKWVELTKKVNFPETDYRQVLAALATITIRQQDGNVLWVELVVLPTLGRVKKVRQQHGQRWEDVELSLAEVVLVKQRIISDTKKALLARQTSKDQQDMFI